MKSVYLTMFMMLFASSSLATEKLPCKHPDTGKKYSPGAIIDKNGRAYECKNDGKWTLVTQSSFSPSPSPISSPSPSPSPSHP